MSTATQCVREVFPGSEIVPNRTDAYPIRVVVTAETGGNKGGVEIWSGRQQNLFGKNRSKREQSMAEIKSKLNELKVKIDR